MSLIGLRRVLDDPEVLKELLKGDDDRSSIERQELVLSLKKQAGAASLEGDLLRVDDCLSRVGADTADLPGIGCLARRNTAPEGTVTLVGRKTLLTAAHLVDETVKNWWFRPCQDATRGAKCAASRKVIRSLPHPTWMGASGTDLALVFLEKDAQGPLVPAGEPTGDSVAGRFFGYGLVSNSDLSLGWKRVVEGFQASRDGNGMYVHPGHCLCSGDSGGPLVLDDGAGNVRVVAVNSGGGETRGFCATQGRLTPLTAAHLDWIRAEMTAFGDPPGW